MVGPFIRVVSITVAALLLLGVGAAQAFNPQPDPPGFGMFGITDFQRAHLHVSLPDTQKTRGGFPPGPCRVEVSFVNEDGKAVMTETHTLSPGITGNSIFTPAREIPTDTVGLSSDAGLLVPAVRQQLRAVVNPLDSTLPPGPCHDLLATVQVDNQQGGAPTLTVSPRDPQNGLPTGKRSWTHFFSPLAIGFGHTARLNAVHVGTEGVCQVDWTFVDETGVRTGGTAMVGPGQAIHADFVHNDATRGVALIRAEATTSGKTCRGENAIGTLEGFDSSLGHSHSIVGTQIILPAIQ